MEAYIRQAGLFEERSKGAVDNVHAVYEGTYLCSKCEPLVPVEGAYPLYLLNLMGEMGLQGFYCGLC
jgi:hypothetical protein